MKRALTVLFTVFLAVCLFVSCNNDDPFFHTVCFDSNGGTSVENQVVSDGEKAERPSDPTNGEKSFWGWMLNGEEYDFDTPVTSDITLKATWNMCIVSFDTDGGSAVDYECVAEGGRASKPTDPTKKGYNFCGWYNGGAQFDFNTSIDSNVCLLALWQENSSSVYYTVSFDTNGGSMENLEDEKVLENTVAYNPGTPVRYGYTFLGWYNGNDKYDFSSKVTGNVSLKARWGYTVTFNSGNGELMYDQYVAVAPNSTISADEITTPTKDGYTFSRWITASGTEFKLGETKVTGNLMLQAEWKKKYTCYIDYNRENYTNTTREFAEGDEFSFSDGTWNIDDPDFRGWSYNGDSYLKSNGSWDLRIQVKESFCLTAIWDGYDIEITFEDGDGNVLLISGIKNGNSVNLGDWVPEKEGYEFAGWYNSEEYKYDLSTKTFNSSVTLYAHWKKLHRVTFKVDDEIYLIKEVGEGNAIDFSHNYTEPSAEDGYKFDDWYVSKSATEGFNRGTAITSDMTLYARFEKKKYYVVFSAKDIDSTKKTSNLLEVEHGSVISALPSEVVTKTKEGWKIGWYYVMGNGYDTSNVDINSPLEFKLGETVITGHTVVFGKWSYKVKFVAAGSVSSQWVFDGDTVQKPVDPTSPFTGDYLIKTFDYWSKDNPDEVENPKEFDFKNTKIDGPITLYAVWRDLKVGDRGPSGGYIFYDRGEVASGEWRYYEAAPVNLRARYTAADNLSGVPSTSVEIGQGLTNTMNLLNTALSTQYPAAIVCNNYTVTNNGKACLGWYLPSMKELRLMCSVLAANDLGSWPKDGEYLSSSAIPGSSMMVYGVNFTYGSTSTAVCFYNYYVRPIRQYPNWWEK